MLALGDGAGVDMSGLPTFPNGRPLSPPSATAISNDALRCTPEISPVNTVRGDSDEPGDSKPEFRLSQCFGDCSPAEEVTQGIANSSSRPPAFPTTTFEPKHTQW